MAEGASAEGPHKVLILEHTLDRILSYLPGRDWKTARLVCRDWNDRVLDNFRNNFHKKLKLRVPGREGEEEEVDERMLTSISVGPPNGSTYVTDLEVVKTTFDTLRSTGYLEGLRVLELKRVDEETLDYLISVANEGCLRNVEEISLSVILEIVSYTFGSCFNVYSYEEEEEEPLNLLSPDALPALKHFSIRSTWFIGEYRDFCCTDIDDYRRYRAGTQHIPQIQSFLAAAPNLETLKSNLPLDLEGEGLRPLRLEHYVLLDSHKVFRMIIQVKGTLRMIEMNHCAVAWCLEEFKPLLPRFEKLREIDLSRVQVSSFRGEFENVESFGLLLNSDVSRLSLVFHSYEDGIPEVRKLLEFVEMRKDSERRERTVLEIRFSEEEDRSGIIEADLNIYKDDLGYILEKLGGRWDLVRLISSKFRFRDDEIRPENLGGKETEEEIPVFEGENLDRVQIIRPDPNHYCCRCRCPSRFEWRH